MNPLNIINTAKLVKSILVKFPETRDSDNLLWLRVIEHTAWQNKRFGELQEMTVPYFLRNVARLNLPHYETVSRTRRKIQANCPELRGTAEAGKRRSRLENKYRQFARLKKDV